MAAERVVMYADGACLGNPGPGGWAVLLRWRGTEKTLAGGDPATTNNRMELMAAIAGLEALKRGVGIDVFTDSTYVKDGISRWLANWKRNGWRTAGRKPVKNAELWQRLDEAARPHDVQWHWVKGHSGHPDNERVDQLARAEAQRYRG